MLKIIFSTITTLLLSVSALAADVAPITLNVSAGTMKAQGDTYYTYDFGTTAVNMPIYREFYLRNDGPVDLYVSQISLSGASYMATHGCPSVLPASTYCTISVRFMPWTEGFSAGRMYISTNGGLVTMDFSGWGVRY